ncbi:MAG: TonB-dependent receptor [Dechloromonas sp.]|nr:MAG: TonB-dependent receptor [Dechloromonas sp.]
MRPPFIHRQLSSRAIAIAALTAGAMSAQAQEAPTPLAPVQVIGEKMGRSEQDSVTAVSVFTAQEIADKDRKTVLDLVAEVPNVTIGEFGGVANIRGSNGAGPGFSSLAWKGATRARTATVIDGVSQVWTGGNLLSNDLWDVEQMEVLRGPQSTMQGRSAIGGAIVLKTKDPSFKQEGAVRLGLQQANGQLLGQAAGVVSGPLSDSLAYRLSADVTRGDHWIDYVDNNTRTGMDYSSDPNKVVRNDIKAKLLWAPKSNPELISRLDLQHKSQKGPYLNQVNVGDDDDYRASMDKVNHRIGDTTMNAVIWNTTYQFDANRSVDVLLSASELDARFTHNDTNGSGVPRTNTNTYFNANSKQDSLGFETRLNLNSATSGLKSMVGISHFEDDLTVLARTYIGAIRYSGDTKTVATALFGEVDYPLSERWALIAGGRIERESQDRTITNGVLTQSREATKTYVLPRLAVRYTLDPQTVFGLDVRKGYNPAGFAMDTDASKVSTYEVEYVTAVEASVKQRFNGGKGHWSINLFNNAFKDYQVRNGTLISNVDEATIRGIEFELGTDLGSATHVYANASLQTSKVDAFAANRTYVGNKLPYAAPRTFGAGVTYKLMPELTLGANAKYVASYYVDISNAAGTIAGQKAQAGDYTLVDISASYAIDTRTRVRAYVNNLFDEYVVNTYFQGTLSQDVLAPRTVGLQLDYRF